MVDRQKRASRKLTQRESVIVALLSFGAGAFLLYVSGRDDWWSGSSGFQLLIGQLGSLLIATTGLSLLWEWRGRQALAQEVYEQARLAADIEGAGLIRVSTQYLSDVDWRDYFAEVRHLDIFFAYGRTWRSAHFDKLQKVARQSGNRIRVVLPDPEDNDLVARLAARFAFSIEAVQAAIREAVEEFIHLKQPDGAEIRVYFHSGDPTFSYYRFDRRAVVTLYSHSHERRLVPTFVCATGGTLYDFLRQEFDDLVEQGQPLIRSNPDLPL
jgi:hypothetical protein